MVILFIVTFFVLGNCVAGFSVRFAGIVCWYCLLLIDGIVCAEKRCLTVSYFLVSLCITIEF